MGGNHLQKTLASLLRACRSNLEALASVESMIQRLDKDVSEITSTISEIIRELDRVEPDIDAAINEPKVEQQNNNPKQLIAEVRGALNTVARRFADKRPAFDPGLGGR